MGQPVLIDDGGSTRIKQLKKLPSVKGKMDDLIEVVTNPGSSAQSKDFAVGPFTQVKITCLDQSGELIALLEAGAPVPAGTFPIALNVGDSVIVSSGNHRLTAKLVNRAGSTTNPDNEIIVKALEGIEPIVEAKHAKRQRRYIISNSPPIDKIVVDFAGTTRPTRTFDVVQEPEPPPTPPVPFAVYTMIVLE